MTNDRERKAELQRKWAPTTKDTPLPADVANMIGRLQAYCGMPSSSLNAADMLERLWREKAEFQAECKRLNSEAAHERQAKQSKQKRIEELEERQMQHDSIDIANAESIEMLQAKVKELHHAILNYSREQSGHFKTDSTMVADFIMKYNPPGDI